MAYVTITCDKVNLTRNNHEFTALTSMHVYSGCQLLERLPKFVAPHAITHIKPGKLAVKVVSRSRGELPEQSQAGWCNTPGPGYSNEAYRAYLDVSRQVKTGF